MKALKATSAWLKRYAKDIFESFAVVAFVMAFLAISIYALYLEHFKSKIEEQAKWCAGQDHILTISADDKRTCVSTKTLVPWRPSH